MTKRIKILYTIPNFDTAGSGKVVYDLVKYIDNTKFEPHICCFHTKGDFFETVKNLNVPIHVFPFAATYKPFISLPLRVLKIRTFFKTHQFDVIHSWHWSSDFTEPLAAKLAGIPFVYTKKAMGWGNRSWKWRSQLSSKIVAINQDMILQFFSNMKDKVVEIPIGLNTDDFQILDKSYQIEDGISVGKDDFVILSIANLVAVKGIELLLDAVKQLNNPQLKVLIVGDDTSDYAQQLKKAYSNNSITFTGKKQNINDYLALADLFVIPTREIGEGQPIAPIEAMLSGRIVIGSKVSGITDVLRSFPDCLFRSNSIENLKSKIDMIMKLSVEERHVIEREMFAFASKNYAIQISIKQHEVLYKNCIKY